MKKGGEVAAKTAPLSRTPGAKCAKPDGARPLFQNYLVELELQITASPGFFLRALREW